MYDWLNERLLIASEETYRDLSNIHGKVNKHRTFEAEILANKERLDNICEVSLLFCMNISHGYITLVLASVKTGISKSTI